jgi:hypothetical protein
VQQKHYGAYSAAATEITYDFSLSSHSDLLSKFLLLFHEGTIKNSTKRVLVSAAALQLM